MKNYILLYLLLNSSFYGFAQTENLYLAKIQQSRASKDSTFRLEESPFSPEKQKKFVGLPYFDINPAYKITASFKKTSKSKAFQMKTTTDRLPLYREFGVLTFEFEGKEIQLTVYQNLELIKKPTYEDYLFLPFRDLTNKTETYGGGRYLDLRIPTGHSIELDFNLAYNPYCAYSERYSCPIPPKKNNLPIPIRAGEKYIEE